MFRSVGGYLIVLGLSATRLPAQDLATMARRLDSSLVTAVAATKALNDYRSAHPPRFEYTDSAFAGGGKVKVYFDAIVASAARDGVAEANGHLEEMGGALDRLSPVIFSIVPDTSNPLNLRRLGGPMPLAVRIHLSSDPKNPNGTATDGDPTSVANVIVTAVSNTISFRAVSQVARWASSPLPLAPRLNPPTDWGTLRLNVVSSPSHFGRSCFLGEIRACRAYLGLDTLPDPIRTAFDSAGRRRVVEYEGSRAWRAANAATKQCVSEGRDDACVAVLERIGVSALSSPFVRVSLVTHALSLGGERAAERLLVTPGPPGAAIAAAANQPLDSVVASWQHNLATRAGGAGNLPLTIAIASLAWVAVCLFLALRSSRWR